MSDFSRPERRQKSDMSLEEDPSTVICLLHSLTAFHFPFVPHYSLLHYSITALLHHSTHALLPYIIPCGSTSIVICTFLFFPSAEDS